MSSVFNLLQDLFEILQTSFNFLLSFLEDLVFVAKLLPQMVSNAAALITSFIPAPALAVILALITLTVVYKILGRD